MVTRDDPFPFRTSVSLEPLFELLEAKAADATSPWRAPAASLLADLADEPGLRGKLSEEALDAHRDLIARMMTLIFPEAGRGRLIGAAVEPFRLSPIFQTPEAERLSVFALDSVFERSNVPADLALAGRVMAGYQIVLERFYGVPNHYDHPFVVTISDELGLKRHLHLRWAPDFVRIETQGAVPELTKGDVAKILEDPLDMGRVTSILPPDPFEFTGFTVVTATDVTPREVVSRLKDDLIQKDALTTARNVDKLQTRIRNLIRSPDAVLGFIAFHEAADVDHMDWARPVGRSLLFSDGAAPPCPMRSHSTYAVALQSHEPVVLSELSDDSVRTGYEAALVKKGFRSVILVPLVVEDRVIGLAELGSPRPGDLNAYSAMALLDVAPLFATAIQRTVEEQADRVEAIIKRNYTAIHPAVEWRFRRAAQGIIADQGKEDAPENPEISFDGVYPLYGLSDIRGSSERRNHAIQADLIIQLELAIAAVKAGAVARPLAVLDELALRLQGLLSRIKEGLRNEDEQAALDFLGNELEPVLERIGSMSEGALARVEAYREALDERLGVVYRRRKAFEDSVASINGLVGRVIDQEERRAQEIFPHLFEKFKTDGVDYNIYVGDEISESGGFHPLLLRELRLWQLMLHCRIDWEARQHFEELAMPMELTHLVLAQDYPLSIRFRADEKRFDVDGAYNIRYEIVKKRIDKATLRGTSERLTQPGRLAVVFSQNEEEAEYRRYFEYLSARGFITGEIEALELNDLQGVYGMRAFRVAIAEAPPRGLEAEDLPQSVAERLVRPSREGAAATETNSRGGS